MIDAWLPRQGLPRGALHEVSASTGNSQDERLGSAALMFAAGVAARLPGRILWCSRGTQDLFMPGLLAAGIDPDRVLCAEAPDEASVLQVMEEGLRHDGLACVVGELARLPITASRRLNLAAEASGVMAIVLHRASRGTATARTWPSPALHRLRPVEPDARSWPDQAIASPTAATTRWQVGPIPSPALATRPSTQRPGFEHPAPRPGSQRTGPLAIPGRGRWHLELTRCRGGEPASWIVEACDAQGRLALPAVLGDRPARPQHYRQPTKAILNHEAWRNAG